jgi:hypothetical protein
MAFLWIRKSALVIVAVVLCAMIVGCAADSQAAQKKRKGLGQKELGQMRYYGGPKSPMWRG